MFAHYNKYRDIVILSSSEPLGRWPEGEKQGSRNVSGMVSARDPSAPRFNFVESWRHSLQKFKQACFSLVGTSFVGMTNYYIISLKFQFR